jgi:IS5 family transposase
LSGSAPRWCDADGIDNCSTALPAKAKGITVRTGTLVNATLIPSASMRQDGAARWAGNRRRKPVHGYKAHIATDQDAALIEALD